MKKIAYFSFIVAVILSVFLVVSGSNAKVSTVVHLDDNQEVIVNTDIAGKTTKQIGKSGYFATTMADVRKSGLSDSVEISPVQSYRQNMVVNDPLEPQAYLGLLNASILWDLMPDTSNRVVAVIDGGFALNHEDLVGRWATNSLEQGATATEGPVPNCTSRGLSLDKSCNNIDDDGNDFIDDWRGWDFAQSDNNPQVGTTNPTAESINHATLVSGIIGATGNNSVGGASLNWQTKILPLQIFTDEGAATTYELGQAISYAIEQNVDVINLSLGSDAIDPAIESLLVTANAKGIIVVASVGNCGGETYVENGCLYEGQTMYPATSNYTIAVGSTDFDDVQTDFSSRSTMIDVVAPAAGVIRTTDYLSTNDVSAYSSYIAGTSFAAPIVSSMMAILRTVWPTATVSDLRAAIVDSAYKPNGMSGSLFTDRYGFGRIQPVDALIRASECKDILIPSDINCDGAVNLLDLSLLASQWQQQYTGRTDSNSSGLVDLLDLSLLASKWGQ
ncbi:MAG TPA: S8 family serine peptidase [Candidatus Angelobacter sp.]|nr:S8 family serine peptidase [Candidatus Angelobacter sp.]